MARIGFVGCGKLGLPVAVAVASRGDEVLGYDIDASRMTHDPQPYREAGPDGKGDFNEELRKSSIRFVPLHDIVRCDIVFVAVQTPHHPMFEGITPLPDGRRDFDYAHLASACRMIGSYAIDAGTRPIVAVISTCLPGTMRREIMPVLGGLPLVYNPFFIAMGTTMRDFFQPDFVLAGSDDDGALEEIRRFYYRVLGLGIVNGRFRAMSIEDAEITKVVYNTFISTKIAFANTVMEMCHRIPGTDCDEVMRALWSAKDRIISQKYLSGGMGDGGGCHPRDSIALSWLSRKLDMKFDFFEAIMRQREKGTEFLADLMCEHDLPKAIVGYTFKPGTNLTVGSPALLLRNILESRGVDVKCWDPYVDPPEPAWMRQPHVFLIGTRHPEFENIHLPEGSVVIDPWRFVKERNGMSRGRGLIHVGIGPEVSA